MNADVARAKLRAEQRNDAGVDVLDLVEIDLDRARASFVVLRRLLRRVGT